MLYSEFINKAMEETIVQADNGLWYLEPGWRSILYDCELLPLTAGDARYEVTAESIQNELELEVKKRNTISSLKPYVLNWVHDIITTSVEPAILQEETDYIKNLTEYLKANKSNQEEKDWKNFTKQ